MELSRLGWTEDRNEEFEEYARLGFVPARVSVQHRGAVDALAEQGELRAELPARLFREAATPAELPVTGDWVALAVRPEGEGGVTVEAVLPRRTKFSRKTAWQATEEQVLCANVDLVLVVSSLNEDLSLRRLERYLTLAWESGAQPVIVLTKSDLADDPGASLADVEAIAYGVPVHVISNLTGEGLDGIRALLEPGRTIALLGSSGVGKSTLVNVLAGEERLATREIRDDGKGRHTTTRRELVILPNGALVIDTPGLRELQLWESEEGLEEAFEDVTELFGACRFADCAHEAEPGCAVKDAIAEGRLARERWDSYRKLRRELEALERKLDKRLQSEQKARWRAFSKQLRTTTKAKRR